MAGAKQLSTDPPMSPPAVPHSTCALSHLAVSLGLVRHFPHLPALLEYRLLTWPSQLSSLTRVPGFQKCIAFDSAPTHPILMVVLEGFGEGPKLD